MVKKFLILVIFVLIICVSYVCGYFNASNDAFLFVKVLSANDNINVINYVTSGKYEEVYVHQKRSLEENITAINDIQNSKSKLLNISARYIVYRNLLSIPLEDEINNINNKYKQIINKSFQN